MSDELSAGGGRRPDEPVSLDQVGRLDSYLDRLLGERSGQARGLEQDELVASILAAQLRLVRDDVESPSGDFLERLDRDVAAAIASAQRPRRRSPLSRRGFLRGAATLAGGVGIGIAVGDAAFGTLPSSAPGELVTHGRGRWYDVAALDDVQVGTVKAFIAGGLVGYLVNDENGLRAVSAICTHMGCRVAPDDRAGPALEFACLCHGSRFSASGGVLSGHARQPLPPIEIRVANGRIYALGTKETL